MTTPVNDVSGKTFDFVVVGGGTAGLALAVRLSEDENASVLVLEAGGANLSDPLLLTPALFGAQFRNPKYDWAFETVPQESLGGRSVYWARGKTLGGSSAINFFQFHRPSKSDIDAFEKLGNPGWNWDTLSKYFDKSSRFIPLKESTEAVSYDADRRSQNGPLKYSYPMVPSGFEQPYHETLKTFDINRVEDPLFGDINGTWITPVTIHPETKMRTYAANVYYTPNQDRKNLFVLVDAHVTSLNLTKGNDGLVTATGVNFIHNGDVHQVSVRKEVILSAGTIMSPQILELSGIGNKEILEKVGVKVIVDLPGVGENVQEHVYSGTTFEVKDDVKDQFTTFDCLRDPSQVDSQKALFTQGKGAFGMAPSCMTFAPIGKVTPVAKEICNELKETIEAGIAAGRYSPGLQKQYKLQLQKLEENEYLFETVLAQGFNTGPAVPVLGKKYVTMASFLNHPFSRGTIHIKSTDPLIPPSIDPHYFEVKQDLRIFVELVKFNRRLVQRKPLADLLTGPEINPGLDANTDEAIGDYLKSRFSTTFHTVGTCSMLPLEDGGVVDPKLKVYGTANIRVVDISIIPLIIGPHPQATAYAIGEIASDIIKGRF